MMQKRTTALNLGLMLLALLTSGFLCGGEPADDSSPTCFCEVGGERRSFGKVNSEGECADKETASVTNCETVDPKREGIVGPSSQLPASFAPSSRRRIQA